MISGASLLIRGQNIIRGKSDNKVGKALAFHAVYSISGNLCGPPEVIPESGVSPEHHLM